MEEWRRCKDTNIYELSSTGKVRNRRTNRMLKPRVNKQGYETVQLHYDGRPWGKRVHRLVAEAFYDGDHNGMDVNHIDGNKRNNCIENLEFCTRQENIRHAHATGLANSNHRKRKVRIVETGEVFDSLTDCGKFLERDRSSVAACLNGKCKTCKKFHLEYV